MQAMRQSWTDDRLDDLSTRMEQRFDEVGQRFDRVEKGRSRTAGGAWRNEERAES
jgi:hypothetical protein